MECKSTLEFKTAQVKEIIADYVRNNFPHCKEVKTDQVTFTINPGESGGYGGYQPASLTNAKVEVLLIPIPIT